MSVGSSVGSAGARGVIRLGAGLLLPLIPECEVVEEKRELRESEDESVVVERRPLR